MSLRTTAFGLFYMDKDAATNWVQRLPAGAAREGAETEIASEWARDDPAAAASWAANLPGEDGRDAVTTVVELWARKNTEAAFDWMDHLSGRFRDETLGHAFSSGSLTAPPEKMLALASTISDGRLRTEALNALLRNWADSEPELAESWIRTSNLSGTEKAALSPEPATNN